MKIFRLILLSIVITAIAACSDKANDTKQITNDKKPQSQQAVQSIVTNNYSGDDWKNGVLQRDGRSNNFYFIRHESVLIDVKVGDTLVFAKTGKAVVQKINQIAPNEKGMISIYVTVDKDLDPDGDGYPNKIFIGN